MRSLEGQQLIITEENSEIYTNVFQILLCIQILLVCQMEVSRRVVQPVHQARRAGCFSRHYAMQLYVIHLGCQPFSGL